MNVIWYVELNGHSDDNRKIEEMGNRIDSTEIGRRLSIARKIAGKEVGESAESVGMSSLELKAVEIGSDDIGIRVIDSLCFYYGTTSARLLNPSAVHTDLVPRYRKLPETEDKHTFEATKLLNNLFSAEVELEYILGLVKTKTTRSDLILAVGVLKYWQQLMRKNCEISLNLELNQLQIFFQS